MVAINRLVKKRLGEMLVEQGLLTSEQVQDALQNNLITEEKIVAVLVSQFGIPYVLPSQYQIAKDLLEIFEPAMMRRYQFVPMDSIGSVLVIAFAGSLTEEVLHEIEGQTGCTLQLFLTKMSEINVVLQNNGM
jgi:type IV pilus assembly protein PilB